MRNEYKEATTERKKEIIKNLRIEQGFTYAEIADTLGVSRQWVQQVVSNLHTGWYNHKTWDCCVYPNLRKWLDGHRYTMQDLLDDFEYTRHSATYRRMRNLLSKKAELRMSEINKFLAITEKTYEELFLC